MKLPGGFVPETELENKVTELNQAKKQKIRNIDDLVLWDDSEEFTSRETLDSSSLEKEYLGIDFDSVCNNYCVKYDDVVLHILQFVDSSCLRNNKKGLKKGLNAFNDKSMYAKRSLIIKDNYAVFMHTHIGDDKNRDKFIHAYRKTFGFKEVKA